MKSRYLVANIRTTAPFVLQQIKKELSFVDSCYSRDEHVSIVSELFSDRLHRVVMRSVWRMPTKSLANCARIIVILDAPVPL